MRAVVQRVREAKVEIEGDVVGRIERGLLVLIAAGDGDSDADLDYAVNKIATLRIFEDDAGKMNLSVEDIGGAILAVSQFPIRPRPWSIALSTRFAPVVCRSRQAGLGPTCRSNWSTMGR